MFIKIIVTAGAKKEKFEAESATRYKISVKEPAKQNLANKRVCMLVARHLKTALTNVRIINGHHSPSKLLSVSTK